MTTSGGDGVTPGQNYEIIGKIRIFKENKVDTVALE